jgi:hypothetical protein
VAREAERVDQPDRAWQLAQSQPGATTQGSVPSQRALLWMESLNSLYAGYFVIYGGIVSGAMMVVSGVSTVAFVYASRRATLRQIQQHLADLVAELRKGQA